MNETCAKHWDISGTGRSRIARSTLLRWLDVYRRSGRKLESLQPHDRSEKGACRSLDGDTAKAFLNLRKEVPRSSLPVLLTIARDRKIIPPELSFSPQSLYQLFRRHGVERSDARAVGRRRFEVKLSNYLWQSDCLHGPKVLHERRLRTAYIFGILDYHSRLIPYCHPYLAENSDNYEDCLIQALLRRVLQRKLYVDYAEEKQMPKIASIPRLRKDIDKIASALCSHPINRRAFSDHPRPSTRAPPGLTRERKGIHVIRHTVASRMLSHGVPVTTVSTVLGHANKNSTDVYLATDGSRMRECALPVEEIPMNCGSLR
jgi:hypothetical protein